MIFVLKVTMVFFRSKIQTRNPVTCRYTGLASDMEDDDLGLGDDDDEAQVLKQM